MMKRFLKALEDKDFSEIFKKGGVSFLMRIVGQIMGFVITFIIAHYFGAKGLGDYVLAIIVLRLFVLIAKLGMDVVSIKFIAFFYSKKEWGSVLLFKKRIFILFSISALFFSVLLFYSSNEIASLIGVNPFYLRLNSFFIFPMGLFMINYQSLRGMKKIIEYSFLFWVSRIFFSVVAILIAVNFSKSSDIPIYSFLIGLIISSLLSVYLFYVNVPQEDQKERLSKEITNRKILKVSLPLMFAQSGQLIMVWSDKLMLGGLMTSGDVGIYDVIFKISLLMSIPLTSITSVSSPKFAEVYETNDLSRLKKITHNSSKLVFLISLPIFLLFMFFSNKILAIFGSDFLSGIVALYFLLIARFIGAISGIAGNLLQMADRQVIFMRILFIGAILNIGLNYILIPIYGIIGASIASMFSIVFWNFLMVYFVWKEFNFMSIYLPLFKR